MRKDIKMFESGKSRGAVDLVKVRVGVRVRAPNPNPNPNPNQESSSSGEAGVLFWVGVQHPVDDQTFAQTQLEQSTAIEVRGRGRGRG